MFNCGVFLMEKNRLETFSDGVLAIIITILAIDLKAPAGHDIHDLISLIPKLLSYVLSFIYIGAFWINHHHMLHTVRKVTGSILWANMLLLFWISLLPFSTSWMGENFFEPWPVTLYGIIFLIASLSYFLLQYTIIRCEGEDCALKQAVGQDWKGKLSILLCLTGVVLALFVPWIAQVLYVVVVVMWLIPDPRIEKLLQN